jgi:hypothetical protein
MAMPDPTLEITFMGLVALVPDTDRLVALLPRTGVLAGNGVHQHHAMLRIPRKYLYSAPSAVSLKHPKIDCDCKKKHGEACPEEADEAPHSAAHHEREHQASAGTTGEPKQLGDEFIPFDRLWIELEGVLRGTNKKLPVTAENVSELVRRKLDHDQVGNKPRSSVWAQVVVPPAREPLCPGDCAEWTIHEKPRTLSHQIIWRGNVDTSQTDPVVTVVLRRLGGTEEVMRFELRLPASETKFEIGIEHLPHRDDMHQPEKCMTAPHFEAYYSLFKNTVITRPIPVLDQEPPKKIVPGTNKRADFFFADTFTCMTAQLTLEETTAAVR